MHLFGTLGVIAVAVTLESWSVEILMMGAVHMKKAWLTHVVCSFLGTSSLSTLVIALDFPASIKWNEIGHDDGVSAYSATLPNSPLVAVRGEVTIPAPIGKVVSVIRDIANRHLWVDYVVKAHVIDDINPDERIEYVLTEGIGPIAPRDFVYQVKLVQRPDQKILDILSHSVSHQRQGEIKGTIRADITSRTSLRANSDSETFVQVDAIADPKGSIPAWIVNIVQRRAPFKTLTRLRNRVVELNDNITEPRFLSLYRLAPLVPGKETNNTVISPR